MDNERYVCRPDVMESCPYREITGCQGIYYRVFSGCGARNRAAARREAAEHGDQDGGH
jgi:hypothetical protein